MNGNVDPITLYERKLAEARRRLKGTFIVFINALRELPASLLLFSSGNETISVAIYEMFEEGAFQLTNAAALMPSLPANSVTRPHTSVAHSRVAMS